MLQGPPRKPTIFKSFNMENKFQIFTQKYSEMGKNIEGIKRRI